MDKSDDNNGMPQTDKSLIKSVGAQTVLWLGLPEEPPVLTPVLGCDLPRVFADQAAPQCWYLSIDFECDSLRVLEGRLSGLVGPFGAIVLSKKFLGRYSFAIRSLKSAFLKLCHHSSVLLVEGAWESKVGDRELIAKVLGEISRIIACSLPGLPIGRTRSNVSSLSILTPEASGRRGSVEDRLRARWQGGSKMQPQADRAKGVAILGAGIAGVTLALELIKRGHSVELFEANSELLGQGSRQPLLATHPQFAKDSDNLSLLTQYSLQLLASSPYASLLKAPGRLQAARSSTEANEQEALVKQLGLDTALLQFLNPTQVKRLWDKFDQVAGLTKPKTKTHLAGQRGWGGLWMALGAQLDVDTLREHTFHLAKQTPKRLNLHLGQRADLAALTRQFQTVIVAAGEGTPALFASQIPANILLESSWKVYSGNSFSMSSVDAEGSCAEVKAWGTTAPLQNTDLAILGGTVSLQSLGDTRWLMGSSYFDASAVAPTEEAQWQFLIEGARALTGDPLRSFRKLSAHPGPRCSVRDRMPLIGPLVSRSPHHGQLYLATAFGSRGLLWAHLAAQLIADHIDGISPRVGLKALKSIDPLRYAERSRSAHDDSTKISSWPTQNLP